MNVKKDEIQWLLTTFDQIAVNFNSNELLKYRKELNELLSRYKQLIPNLQITRTKTESYSKCFTYEKEVREIYEILTIFENRVEIKNLSNLDNTIKTQSETVNKLMTYKETVQLLIESGKKLINNKDNCIMPILIKNAVTDLENKWTEMYTKSKNQLNQLNRTKIMYDGYEKDKNEILSLISEAEMLLKSIRNNNNNNKKVTDSDFEYEQNVLAKLKMATSELLGKFKKISQNLKEFIAPNQQLCVDNELNEIDNKLQTVYQHLSAHVEEIQKIREHESFFLNELEIVQNWLKNINENDLESLKNDHLLNPEEKFQKITNLKIEINEKCDNFDTLLSNVTDNDDDHLKFKAQQISDQLNNFRDNIEKNYFPILKSDFEMYENLRNQFQEIQDWFKNQLEVRNFHEFERNLDLESISKDVNDLKNLENVYDNKLQQLQQLMDNQVIF